MSNDNIFPVQLRPYYDDFGMEAGRDTSGNVICICNSSVWVVNSERVFQLHAYFDIKGNRVTLDEEEIRQVVRNVFDKREFLTLEEVNEALPDGINIKQI